MSTKIKYNQEIDGSLTIPQTQDSNAGVIFKGSNSFIHNFEHPTGGGALPVGQNTFLGESAGNFTMGATATSVNEASNNIAIGFEAFESNTLGAFNVAVGTRSLEANTIGSQNYAFGHSALRNNISGDNNSAIGYYSMFANTTGEQNVAVGYRTLEDLDGANNNVAIGYAALQELTTGEEMVAIGMNAGRYISGGVTPNTTSTHSVYIGYGTEPSADGNTDEIVIGYNTTGNGSNTATIGNTSINDTYLFGQLHTENYSFPTADGTSGYVLKTDGLGALTWQADSGSGAFSSDGTTITEAGAEYDVDFVVGSPQLDDDGTHDARMFFDKSQGFFAAGGTASTEWDSANRGFAAVVLGNGNTSSGDHSFSMGTRNISSGEGSVSFGYEAYATGENSFALGDSLVASADSSFARGDRANAYLYSCDALASGDPNSQRIEVVVSRSTSGTTTEELTLGASTPSATSRLIIPAETTWGFKIYLTARQTAGTSGTVGDSHIFEVKGGIKRDGANNTAMIGTASVSTIVNDAAAAAWTVAVSADDTNESLKIDVTGETDKTIHWSAKVELVEVG